MDNANSIDNTKPENLHYTVKQIAIVFGIVIGALLFHKLLSNVTVGSESVKPYVLWRVSGIPKQGDYVTFPWSHPMIKTKATIWVKYLACNEGQLLERKDDKFYCNGEYFADARLYSKAHMLLPQFEYSGIIPKAKAFVLGDGSNSFDSRHFGLVPNTQMVINKKLL